MLILWLMANLESANKAGRAFGESAAKRDTFTPDTIKSNPILSATSEEPGSVDNADVQFMMDARQANKGDGVDGDKLVDAMIVNGDTIVNNPEKPLAIGIRAHTPHDQIFECEESDTTPVFIYHRTWTMIFDHKPAEIKKACFKWVTRCVITLQNPLRGNPHKDDSPNCKESFETEGPEHLIDPHEDCERVLGWKPHRTCEKIITPASTVLTSEDWQKEDPHGLEEKVKSNECNIVGVECVEGPATRNFYGTNYRRDCWRERITVECPGEYINTCEAIRKKGCEFMDQNGTKKRYRCPARTIQTIDGGHDKIHGIDGGNLVAESVVHSDMASSLAQLSAVAAMQKDCQNFSNPMIFKGEIKKCTKNVLGSVLYDCCGSLEGFAVTLNLTRCNAEEKQLSALRKEKRCHHVGSYPNEMIAWKSSDTHVYCCYPSKLVFVLQKEARKQLNKNFGTPKQPDCEGLTIDQISSLDFSKMDLSPIFDDILKNAKTGRPTVDLKDIEKRMKIKQEEVKKHGEEVTSTQTSV